MKQTFTSVFLFLMLAVNTAYAQFTTNDVVFWIGEGDSEAVLAVDFRDDTSDPSFAWGYRFNAGEGKTFKDMLLAVEAAEPNFSVVYGSGGAFLSSIYYNSHSGIDSQPDWWSTWSGTSLEGLTMNGGISEPLADGSWYGTSYGFMNPEPTQPTVTYPAYNSLWFTVDELTYSIGEGANSAVIVVDFVADTDTSTTSFAWKINFDGSITPQNALELIAQNNPTFEVTFTGGTLTSVVYGAYTGNEWTAYSGTNLSDWVVSDLTTAIENNDWFGISKGDDVRRPFTPTPAEEASTAISIEVQTQDGVPAEITIDNGTLQLIAVVTPDNTVQTVIWTIETGETLAEVDEDGLITALDNGTVVVRATSAEDEAVYGEITITISNQDTVNTPEFGTTSIAVYPNPAYDSITIQSNNNIESIILYNLSGQKVMNLSGANTLETINVSSLNAGIYLLEIRTGQKTTIQKIVKK